MARRRFFVDAVSQSRAVLRGENARHLRQVLRAEAGQQYELSDNRSVYLAAIEEVRKGEVVFRLLEELHAEQPTAHFTLLLALIKFDRFEWALEKATELGVETIVPIAAGRSERGLERAAWKRIERWRRIVRESSQQARRARLPEIRDPAAFGEAILQTDTYRYILDEDPGARPMLAAAPNCRHPSDRIALLVGPEGGWTPGERAGALEAGWCAVSLGRQILRAETATIAALAVLQSAWSVSTLAPPG